MHAPIGIGIHGCGQVAREHAKAYLANPNCRIIGLSSRRASSAEAMRRELNLQCRIFRNFDELVSNPRVDAVSICTPNFEHASQAVQAARARKHICLEKPVAINFAELQELREAVLNAGVRSIVSFVLRWNSQIINTKRLLESGAIGEIYFAEADYWHGISPQFRSRRWLTRRYAAGGAVMSGGCHAIDLLRWLVGKEIVEVSGALVPSIGHANPNTPWGGKRTRVSQPEFDYATTVNAIIRFDNGAIGKIGTCLECRAPYMLNIDLLGTKGTIRDDKVYSPTLMPGQKEFSMIPTLRPDSGAVTHHPFQNEIDAFVEAVLSGRDASPNIEDAARTQEVCLAIEDSARSGAPVRLPLGKVSPSPDEKESPG